MPLDGMAQATAQMGMPALALTDHLGIYGAVRFTKACREVGIRPIIGAELVVQPPADWPNPATVGKQSGGRVAMSLGRPGTPDFRAGNHLVVLVRNQAGYANLCRLITSLHCEGDLSSGIRWVTFVSHFEGLHVLSGCRLGEVSRWLACREWQLALRAAIRYRDLLGSSYSLEVTQRHDAPILGELGERIGVRVVATNNVHYLHSEDWKLHETLVAIRNLDHVDTRSDSREGSPTAFLKSPQEMRALYRGYEQLCDATLEIAADCQFEFDFSQHHLPQVSNLGKQGTGQTDVATQLRHACEAGLDRRGLDPASPKVIDQLDHELDTVIWLGFAGYFLLVAEIADQIRSMGIRCACRGSAAGSLVTYLLGISDVNPLEHDLCFARFLSDQRRTLPDIDLDVESHRRGEIISWLMERFGVESTVLVGAVSTYRARGAIREVGKALGYNEFELARIAKIFPHVRAGNIATALEEFPELSGVDLSAHKDLFDLSVQLDRFPRHLSMHPCAVILGPSYLRDYIPLQPSSIELPMAQFDKDDVEALGFVKLDILGVRMQSAISHALREIERVGGEASAPDLAAIAPDDPSTFALIRSSKTLGCFQIESPGQRELLGRLLPNEFEDLIADISLFRPGPMKADMISPFLIRRHDPRRIPAIPPILDSVLGPTHGVIIFHEQVIRVLARILGITEAEADVIRRQLGPLESDEMTKLGERFQSQAINKGLSSREAGELWAEIAAFASFGFCKAHAAAFSVLTYQSAWLKAHYPAAFFAGILTHDPGMYPRRLLFQEAKRCGVEILPIDINQSGPEYVLEGSAVNPMPVK